MVIYTRTFSTLLGSWLRLGFGEEDEGKGRHGDPWVMNLRVAMHAQWLGNEVIHVSAWLMHMWESVVVWPFLQEAA